MSTQSQQNENTWINAQMPLSLRNKAEMLSAEMGLDNLSALIRYLIMQEWNKQTAAVKGEQEQ